MHTHAHAQVHQSNAAVSVEDGARLEASRCVIACAGRTPAITVFSRDPVRLGVSEVALSETDVSISGSGVAPQVGLTMPCITATEDSHCTINGSLLKSYDTLGLPTFCVEVEATAECQPGRRNQLPPGRLQLVSGQGGGEVCVTPVVCGGGGFGLLKAHPGLPTETATAEHPRSLTCLCAVACCDAHAMLRSVHRQLPCD